MFGFLLWHGVFLFWWGFFVFRFCLVGCFCVFLSFGGFFLFVLMWVFFLCFGFLPLYASELYFVMQLY